VQNKESDVVVEISAKEYNDTDDQPENDAKKEDDANSDSDSGYLEKDDEEDKDGNQQIINKGNPKQTLATKAGKPLRNELTSLIPGYTAPMSLNTSLLDRYRPTGGMSELQRRAERTDASTRNFVVESTQKHVSAMKKTSEGTMPSSYTAAYASFKKGTKRAPDTTAGDGWFGMAPSAMTDELKTDLAVIRNRTYLDPKRFYKSSDTNQKIVQVGTVIEGSSEFFSARLTKKQRRSNLTEEIMADPSAADYTKNKFRKMQQAKTEEEKKRKKRPKRGKRAFY
jgi:hypothetical protein